MTILSAIILTAYLVYVYCKVGVPNCLSDTAYSVSKPLFAVTMIAVSALLWLPLIHTTSDMWLFLVFLAQAGMVGMAVSPYKEDWVTHNVHYACTLLSVVCTLSLWAVKGLWQVPVAAILIAIAMWLTMRKWMLFAELLAFGLIYSYCINY